MKFYKILFLFSLTISQEIPNEFSEFHKRKILTELGMDWSQNSIFGPVRWIHNDRYSDSLLIQNRFGFEALTDNSKLIYPTIFCCPSFVSIIIIVHTCSIIKSLSFL